MDNFLTYGIQWNNGEEGIKTSIYTKARTHEVAHSVHYLSLSKETSLWKDKESNGSYLQTIWNCMIHLGCCQIQRKWLHFTSWRVPFTRRIPEWLCSWFWEFSLDLWWQNSMIRTTFFFRVLNTQCGSAFLFLIFKQSLLCQAVRCFHLVESIRTLQFLFFSKIMFYTISKPHLPRGVISWMSWYSS